MEAYLDNAAGTRLRPEALAAMVPWLQDGAANPTGSHRAARVARRTASGDRAAPRPPDAGRGPLALARAIFTPLACQ
jgi:cysteine desulfurase